MLHLFVMADCLCCPADGPLSRGTHFCPRLVTCHEKPTGWPLFNHCLCATDQGDRVFAREVHIQLEMGKDFTRSYVFRMVTSTFMPGPVQIWGWEPLRSGVNKKHQKYLFEYRVFSQKLYLNMWCFEKVHICIPNMRYLHTK